MKPYNVIVRDVVTEVITVEARDPEEAKTKALWEFIDHHTWHFRPEVIDWQEAEPEGPGMKPDLQPSGSHVLVFLCWDCDHWWLAEDVAVGDDGRCRSCGGEVTVEEIGAEPIDEDTSRNP